MTEHAKTQTCEECGIEREIKQFRRRSWKYKELGRNSKCLWCMSGPRRSNGVSFNDGYKRRTTQKYREKVKKNDGQIIDWLKTEYEGKPCPDCDGVFPWCSMDFDHRPGEKKLFLISRRGSYTATEVMKAKVEKEIAKCDLVCANCHRVRTWITRKA